MANGQHFPVDLQMRKAVHLMAELIVRGRLLLLAVAQGRATAARHDEGRGVAGKFQMLQVMDMSAEISMDAVLAEEAIPFRDERLAVAGIRVKRMVPADDEKGRGARLRQ